MHNRSPLAHNRHEWNVLSEWIIPCYNLLIQLTVANVPPAGSPGLFVAEDAVVDVCHQVPSWGVGHDEAHVVGSLKAAVQVDQEGVLGSVDRLEDPLLTLQAANRMSHNGVQGSAT